MRNGGIELVIEQLDPLEDHFKTLPNALLQGKRDDKYGFDFRGYTLRERGLLAAFLSMGNGWRCTRAEIAALAGGLKDDALDTVLKGLRAKGHIHQTRVNDPTRHGWFVWVWRISLRPMMTAADLAGEETPAQTMGGKTPHGKTAGHTMGGLSTGGPSIDGKTGSSLKEPGSSSKNLKTTTPGPSTRRRAPAPRTPDPVEAAVDLPESEDPPPDFVAEVLDLVPRWTPTLIREALTHPDVAWRPRDLVRAALLLIARGRYGHTTTPLRVVAAGPWWDVVYGRTPDPTDPTPDPGPPRHLCFRGEVLVPDPADPRQDTRHPCPVCRPDAAAASAA